MRRDIVFKEALTEKTPLILAMILLIYSFNNIYTFILVKKGVILYLLIWNTCTPVSIATAVTLISGREMRALSSSMIPLLLWFGFIGLFMFWWGWLDIQLAIFMQGHHLVMTATAIYLIKTRRAKKGIFVGTIILLLLFVSFRLLGPYAPPLW